MQQEIVRVLLLTLGIFLSTSTIFTFVGELTDAVIKKRIADYRQVVFTLVITSLIWAGLYWTYLT